MITFITGVPGSSKTLNTIKMVQEEWGETDRPVYYAGIKDLSLDWIEIQYDDVKNWRKDIPEGSIIVIDEAYNAWPRRSNNKEVPQSIVDLATHRHGGYDFYIITQKHTSVDHGVREQVGRHFHYERAHGWESARRWEFQKAVDPDDYHEREVALKQRVKFDKSYYGVYKSAEVHTFKKKVPKKIIAIAALLVITLGLGYSVLSNPLSSSDKFEASQYDAIPTERHLGQTGDNGRIRLESIPADELYIETWTPRVDDIPYSAPAYDKVTEVKTYPRPQCMYHIKKDVCSCFTQQATPLDISYPQCMNIVENGWFNPFVDESQESEGGERAQALAARATLTEPDPQPRITIIDSASEVAANAYPPRS